MEFLPFCRGVINNIHSLVDTPIFTGTTPTADSTPTWSWNKPAGTMDYRYSFTDGSEWIITSENSYTSTTILLDGDYTLYVQARDYLNNWSLSGTFVVSVETVTPVVGGYYGGGIIFYLDGNGGGLVASESDQTESYGTKWESAKGLCSVLVLNGYDNWFLPSINELGLMYDQKSVIGGFASANYWSSTPYFNGAVALSFYDGGQNYYPTYDQFRVRAIRGF